MSPPGDALGAGVGYRFTDRNGGDSPPPYSALNLGTGLGDDPAAVAANRRLAVLACGPGGPGVAWMRQVHGREVRYAGAGSPEGEPPECDALYTDLPGLVLGVLVADCVPVLLADPGLLPPAREILLVCASGKRSLAAARELRKRGLAVRSLAGGLQSLEK